MVLSFLGRAVGVLLLLSPSLSLSLYLCLYLSLKSIYKNFGGKKRWTLKWSQTAGACQGRLRGGGGIEPGLEGLAGHFPADKVCA